MNFNQMKKIREIRAASFGQVFGLLVLLSGFIGSTGFRVNLVLRFLCWVSK